MNRKAQFFTLDLLLALIPLTLVLGMSANAISGISSQSQDYVSTYSFHRQANDLLDILVKTPGLPVNWEETLNATVNGAAVYDSANQRVQSNYISARKIYNLNTTQIEEVLGTANYNLSLFIEDPSLFSNFTNFTFPTHGTDVPDVAHEQVAVERLMVVDNLLQISEDAPEGFADVSNLGGGRQTTCFNTTMDLNQEEINYYQFWMYLGFNCPGTNSKCPTSLVMSLNSNCDDDRCNRLFVTSDVPFDNNFNLWPANDGTTFINKSTCPDPPGTEVNVEYWINKTADKPGVYAVYVKVPKEFLTPGIQEIYVDVRGVESITTGFVATAPQEITRETLLEYFAARDKYKDKKGKLVLRMWR